MCMSVLYFCCCYFLVFTVVFFCYFFFFFFFKQKTAYEMRISDWSSDVCSSDLYAKHRRYVLGFHGVLQPLVAVFLVWAVWALVREPTQIGRASCRERVCQYV